MKNSVINSGQIQPQCEREPVSLLPPGPSSIVDRAEVGPGTGATNFERIDEKCVDINIKIYESIRAELIQRVILRDGALLFYIAAVGSYLSQAVTYHYSEAPERVDLLRALILMVPLPITCLIFSLIVLQHHMTIGKMGSFLRHEMNWGKLSPRISTHWDNSKTFLDQANLLILFRLYGQGLVLMLPLIYSTAFFSRFKEIATMKGVAWVATLWALLAFNMLAGAFIGWLHLDTHQKRKKDWA